MTGFTYTTSIKKIRKLTKRVRAIKGGSSAGKTYGVLPVLIDKCAKIPNYRISVVSQTMPHLKKGAERDFKKIMKQTGRWVSDHWHGTDHVYTFSNGSYIEFFSADSEEKLRGPRRDELYINECNSVEFEAYRQLAKRTEHAIYLDWNPTSYFWFDQEMRDDEDVEFITLTYLDNEAAPKAAVDDILKSKQKGFYNPDLDGGELFKDSNIKNQYWANDYKVYGLGEVGRLQGTVFQNWERGVFDESLPFCYGLDFGFSPDPTALSKVAVDSNKKLIYVEELAYLKELSTQAIVDLLRSKTIKGSLIVSDCAEKRLINDLINENINVAPCQKGKDSVKTGIKNMQDYQIIVCGESKNIENELNNYIWNDKKAGIPIDNYNHLIDGIRYAFDRLSNYVGIW